MTCLRAGEAHYVPLVQLPIRCNWEWDLLSWYSEVAQGFSLCTNIVDLSSATRDYSTPNETFFLYGGGVFKVILKHSTGLCALRILIPNLSVSGREMLLPGKQIWNS